MTYGNGGNLDDMSMMDLFRMEAENQCSQLSEDLLALEQDPAASVLLESLMRASHSIKGAARIVELHPVVQVAHAMEDVFVAAQDSRISLERRDIDLLLQGVDMLNAIAQVPDEEAEPFFTEKRDEIASLVSLFTALASGKKTNSEAPGATAAEPPAVSLSTPDSSPMPAAMDSNQLPVDLSAMTMLDLFRIEAGNHCARLSEDLAALAQDFTDPVLLAAMMRAAHSMKGAARIVGLHEAVNLAHAMEEVFVAAHKGKIIVAGADLAVLKNAVDMLATIARMPESGTEEWFADHGSAIDDLVRELAGLSHREKSAKSPPAPRKPPLQPTISQDPPADREHLQENRPEPTPPYAEVTKPARRAEDKDGIRAVRVSAQNMDRMMGLAGESLIESRWLPTFNKELLNLKKCQDELYKYIDRIRENLQTKKSAELTMSLVGDLHDKLEICRAMLLNNMGILEDHASHATSISHRLYKEILTSKMRPFSEGVQGFSRMVRDIARELGKDIHFELIGADTMVDRDILDKIEAPLNHMIRNALDHGIEPAADRVALGKPAQGTIQLIARHSAGMLNITVRDDGRGVDLEKLRQTVVERKLCTPDIAADLADHELLEFLFLPNFSTKKSVSKVSGRGVGLDVVHSVINEIRGKIRSSTKLNEGSVFELQLPLTLSVLRALLTEINGELYGFPLVSIDHVLQLQHDQIQEIEGRQYFTFHEKRIGIVSAQQVFKTENSAGNSEDKIFIIVFSDRFHFYGLTVDKLLGVRDLLVQHLDPRLGKVKDISSASILEDGSPVLIIDVEDLFNSLDQLISGNRLIPIGSEDDTETRTKRILVADDSITVREVERKMLTARGYEVDVAVDGMDAWNTVRANEYDLLISDIDMPRLNGFELVSLIKNDPNLHSLPVIIVSYKDREEERNKGLEVGADYYLSKGSFHDQALVNAVLDLIGEPRE